MEILVTPEMLGERDTDGALIRNPQIDISGRPVKAPYLTTTSVKGTRYFVVVPSNASGDIVLKWEAPKSVKGTKDETAQG